MSVELDKYTRIDYQNVLPAEVAQRVDRVLEFIRTTKNQWFTAKTPEEVNLIIPEAQKLVDRFHLATSAFGEIEICLNSPAWPIDDVMEEAAKAAGREDGILFAQLAAYNATGAEIDIPPQLAEIDPESWWYDPIALGFSAGFAASWETVSDLGRFQGKENPGMLMLELYKLGAARINFHLVDGERKLVIDFPILLNEKYELGCWVEQDPKLNFYHRWSEWCEKTISIASEIIYSPRIIKPLRTPPESTVEIAYSPIPDEVKKLLEDSTWLNP